MNVARTIGPAVAGILIATVGTGVCFLVNAASFVAVIASLATLDRTALNPTKPTPRAPGQLREGLRYVRRTPELGIPLLMMALVGCLAYEFQVSLPVMAKQGLHLGRDRLRLHDLGDGRRRRRRRPARRREGQSRPAPARGGRRGAFGLFLALASIAQSLALELVALALAGGASIAFMSTGNSTLQLGAAPNMRGRVMSLWFVAFQGSTPIGGPIIGWVMATAGARAGLGVGAITCLLVAGLGLMAVRRGMEPRGIRIVRPAGPLSRDLSAGRRPDPL